MATKMTREDVVKLNAITTPVQRRLIVAMYRLGPSRLHHVNDDLGRKVNVMMRLYRNSLAKQGATSLWRGRLTRVGRQYAKALLAGTSVKP